MRAFLYYVSRGRGEGEGVGSYVTSYWLARRISSEMGNWGGYDDVIKGAGFQAMITIDDEGFRVRNSHFTGEELIKISPNHQTDKC